MEEISYSIAGFQEWIYCVMSSLALAGSPRCHRTRPQWSHSWVARWPGRGAYHWVFNRWASEKCFNVSGCWVPAEAEWWIVVLSQVRAHCPLMILIRKWWVRQKSLSPSPTNLMFLMRPMLKWMPRLSFSSKDNALINCSVPKPNEVSTKAVPKDVIPPKIIHFIKCFLEKTIW